MTLAKSSKCLSGDFHQSKSEAEYCNWLLARKKNGEILDYSKQVSIPLIVNGKVWRFWKIDFVVTEKDGSLTYHESKGWNRSDDSFKLKRDLFLIIYPDRKLFVNKELWAGNPDRDLVKHEIKILDKRKDYAKAKHRVWRRKLKEKKSA